MKILFVSWELDPLIKIGGLGDVAKSLPQVLIQQNTDIRIVIPFYKVLNLHRTKKAKIGSGKVKFANIQEKYSVYLVYHPTTKVPVYLVQNTRYLDIRKTADMFAFFNKAVAHMLKDNLLSWQPEIIHCNDHHMGLIPLLVKDLELPMKTIMTIHNMVYQGTTGIEILDKIGFIRGKSKLFRWEKQEKEINFLKEGIIHADIVTTVSPTYAKEIMGREFGMGLDDVLRGREGRVFGILNGIENRKNHSLRLNRIRYPTFKPDGTSDWFEDKKLNKKYLQKKLGLKEDEKQVLFGFIGRFEPRQKGLDILHEMLTDMDFTGMQFVFLGSGDHDWEEKFHWLGRFFPKNISCTFKFDEKLARQIYAGSDFFLVPSKFEPCGLIQMIAMSYGAIPIAHKTGGLADSIEDGMNGFLFDSYSAIALHNKVEKAVEIFKHDKEKYKKMAENAYNTDFSWKQSAVKYLELYNKLVNGEL